MAKKQSAQPTEQPAPTTPALPTPAPAYTGPVAFIKSHTTVVFGQKVRACTATARSPRGHDIVCEHPFSRVTHLLHAMGEARPNGVRVVFWKVTAPAAASSAPAPPTAAAPKARKPNGASAGPQAHPY